MSPFSRSRKDEFAELLQGTQLVRETRWSREYHYADGTLALHDSRFRDGSATISRRQLSQEWGTWPDREKLDFCKSFAHYRGRELAEMLRFLVANGNDLIWQTIAISVAMTLPANEAVSFLRDRIDKSESGTRANYFQGCWLTRSNATIPILREALAQLWGSPELMKHDPFCNWVTNDAIWCVDALVRLGEPRESLSIYYQMLKSHSSMGSQAQQWLGEHFEKCNVPSRDVLEN